MTDPGIWGEIHATVNLGAPGRACEGPSPGRSPANFAGTCPGPPLAD